MGFSIKSTIQLLGYPHFWKPLYLPRTLVSGETTQPTNWGTPKTTSVYSNGTPLNCKPQKVYPSEHQEAQQLSIHRPLKGETPTAQQTIFKMVSMRPCEEETWPDRYPAKNMKTFVFRLWSSINPDDRGLLFEGLPLPLSFNHGYSELFYSITSPSLLCHLLKDSHYIVQDCTTLFKTGAHMYPRLIGHFSIEPKDHWFLYVQVWAIHYSDFPCSNV